jgi:hypothetical protein
LMSIFQLKMQLLSCARRNLSTTRLPPPFPGTRLDMENYLYIDKTHLLARILTDDPYESTPPFLHACGIQ